MAPPEGFKVLIVGAGIGGLMLANLLERAQIDYEVFERAASVKPLGSALSLGANVFYSFKQLGLLDELLARSKPFGQTRAYGENRSTIRVRDYSAANELAGYLPHIVARPELYDILQKALPAHKIHFQKRVLSLKQKEDEVSVRCSDNTIYDGSIIVGADGAYSGIRQGLFKKLFENGTLPESDFDWEQLPFSSVCLVGQTRVMGKDDERFKDVMEETFSRFDIVVGDNKPYSWVTFTTRQNALCWMVIQHLDAKSSLVHDAFRNSEWGPESAQIMCNEVKDFPLPSYPGLTIGDLIKETDKDLISKVMLEEKLFETWYGGRTVLLGDACHKAHPAAGLGAVSAIHDAIVLANVLHDLPSGEPDDITEAFQAYREERYPIAKVNFETSRRMSQILGKNFINTILRFLVNHIPDFIAIIILKRMYGYRPQANFLPLVPDRGSVKPLPQLSLRQSKSEAV
ncbi:hypothetical protein EDD21DRAFT_402051 [Dissophora ornata]|nr:hypothetical protein BGZ58_004716 [Dissophora ornata]KAI8604422.1 hypothetical protein EDD21DRAFT_402051 [Dissophora ornata]